VGLFAVQRYAKWCADSVPARRYLASCLHVSWDFRVRLGEVALRGALISAPIGLMGRPEFVSLVNPLATDTLGESASVEIQASVATWLHLSLTRFRPQVPPCLCVRLSLLMMRRNPADLQSN
jgi:hypothetical protein